MQQYLMNLFKARDRAWFERLYGEIIPSFSEGIIDRTGIQTRLYLTCTMISSVDLAHYGVSVVVVLLFYVHGKHLRSCQDGQLTLPHVSWAGLDLLSG